MDYSIGEFSRLMGLGIHTLRYYEKERLLAPQRQPNGRRRYSERDVAWVQFIRRLKDTGMPIREIQKYAALRAAGDSTMEERLELLLGHRAAVLEEIAKWNDHLAKLDEKIAFYRAEIGGKPGGAAF